MVSEMSPKGMEDVTEDLWDTQDLVGPRPQGLLNGAQRSSCCHGNYS